MSFVATATEVNAKNYNLCYRMIACTIYTSYVSDEYIP